MPQTHPTGALHACASGGQRDRLGAQQGRGSGPCLRCGSISCPPRCRVPRCRLLLTGYAKFAARPTVKTYCKGLVSIVLTESAYQS